MSIPQRKQLILEPVPCRSPEVGRWLAALQDARHRTHSALDGIQTKTMNIVDWVSPVSGNSVGMILYHLAAVEASWLYEEVLQEDFPADINDLLPYDIRDGQDHLIKVQMQHEGEHRGQITELCLSAEFEIRSK